MLEQMKQYFEVFRGTPRGRNSSVHNSTYRLDEAKKQAKNPSVDIDVIISYVNEFLENIGMKTVKSPIIKNPLSIDYERIKSYYGLSDIEDIVWMKFTVDGYCGVVATSNDINFDIPPNKAKCDEKLPNNRWKYNSAGVLIRRVGKEWDTSFVLVFPLPDIPDKYKRGDIERAIGNYLISKGVPVLDFYSHNY